MPAGVKGPQRLIWQTRLRRCALALGLIVGLSACQAGIFVDVDFNSDGSGVVTVELELDSEALALAPDIASLALTQDIQDPASGWNYSRPETDTSARFSASKRFGSPQQLESVLAEIFGSSEVFRDFEFERNTAFAETNYRVTGVVDLSSGLDLIADPELTGRLDGHLFGEPVEDLQALMRAVTIELDLGLPVGPKQTLVYELGQAAEQLEVTAQHESTRAITLRWVAYAAFALVGLAVLIAVAGYLLERRARESALESGLGQAALLRPATLSEPDLPQKRLQLVVVNPLGVLYEPARNPSELLGDFVRQRGGDVATGELEELHRQALLGRITPAELWAEVGFAGDSGELNPEELNEAFLAQYRVRSGARDFVGEMVRRELSVACLANDTSAWSVALRERFQILGVDTWIVSSEVGVCMPAPGIYEALRRTMSIPYENTLLVDVNVEHLDAARELGMSTALLADDSADSDEIPRHAVVRSFSDFFRRRSRP